MTTTATALTTKQPANVMIENRTDDNPNHEKMNSTKVNRNSTGRRRKGMQTGSSLNEGPFPGPKSSTAPL